MKIHFRPYKFTIKEVQGNALIFDIIRKGYFRLTPEEWVRQHLVHYFTEDLGVPSGLIAIEREIIFNGLRKRFDICVFDSAGKPLLLAECKAPSVPLTAETMLQAGIYNRQLDVKYLLLCNGEESLLFKRNAPAQVFDLQEQLPVFAEWF